MMKTIETDGATRHPVTITRGLVWAALTVAGYLGNVAYVPLFFNVDFLFGSTFIFLVLHYFGWGPAVVSAAIASAHTAVLWHHPYALIIMTVEMIFVGYFYRRRSRNMMVLDTIYWLLIGMPLVVLFYLGVMDVTLQGTLLVVFKQAINGIVNALLASIIIATVQHFLPRLERPSTTTPFGFSHAIFLAMVAFVLLPAMVILVVAARQEMGRVENDVQEKLEITAFSADQAVNAWIAENVQTLRTLSAYAGANYAGNLNALRTEMGMLKMSDVDFRALAVVDVRGRVMVGEPIAVARRYLSGEGLANVPYFARITTGAQWVASDVIGGTGDDALVLMGVPVVARDQFAGAALGILDVQRMKEVLYRATGNWSVQATLVDGNGIVLASTQEGVEPFRPYRDYYAGPADHLRENLWVRMPEVAPNVSIMERWQQSEYLSRDRVGANSSWELVLNASLAPYQDALNARYRSMLLLVMVIIVGTILLAASLSKRMLASLTQLTVVTENLPDKVTRHEELDWPSSRIQEISSLIEGFRTTGEYLSESFRTIQQANEELEAATREAEAANAAKSQFLANISHDLRTPLNGILGYAQILGRDPSLDARTREAVAIIEKSGTHLLNLINDILDVSRIEADKLSLNPQPIRLASFLDDIADIVTLQARRKALGFHTQFSDQLPEVVEADDKRLRQILLNLLTNAVKFTDKGNIWFRARPEGEGIRFEVEDTGIGIPADEQKAVFTPFRQLTKHIQSEEGTGLGLAIVQRLVEMMGGNVTLDSEPGKGSIFGFTVPLAASDRQPARPEASSLIVGYQGRRRSILVVDDRTENRDVLRTMLEPMGFGICEARNGREGIDAIRNDSPDLVLMDLVMPVMDGFEAIREIRSRPDLQAAKVVAISASVAQTIREECIRVGFDDFLPKPFRELDLLQTIRDALGLTWEHESRTPSARRLDAGVEYPSAVDVAELRRHAAAGNVRRVIESAKELAVRCPHCATFAEEVISLAGSFQVNRLIDYLNYPLRDSVAGEGDDDQGEG